YRCLRTRAQVAEAAGDRARADRFLAEAVRQNPKITFAEADWAQLLLARGDPAGAIAKARAAHAKSPNFAEPLVTWGEARPAERRRCCRTSGGWCGGRRPTGGRASS